MQHRLLAQLRESRHDLDPQLPREAARALLGPRSVYSGDSAAVVDYDRDKVALPSPRGRPVPLVSVLDAEAASLLTDFEGRMLRDDGEYERVLRTERIGRYTDARLRRDPALMKEFLAMLAQRRLLVAVREVRGRVSPLFVRQKNDSQRLVLAFRLSNCAFRAAPFAEIAAAESFVSMVVDPGRTLKLAATDIEACFYQCGLPPGLAAYFHLGSANADEALSWGVERFDDGATIRGVEGRLQLAFGVLPMGWVWLMQRVHLDLVSRSEFPYEQVAVASWAFPPLERGACEVPYSDNVTAVGYDEDAVRSARPHPEGVRDGRLRDARDDERRGGVARLGWRLGRPPGQSPARRP